MNSYTKYRNILIFCFIFLVLIIVPAQQGILAGSGPVMPDPIMDWEGIERMDNQNASWGNVNDPDVYPPVVNQGELNDPELIGAVPDTSGAAGYRYYMQAVNELIAVYRKDGSRSDTPPPLPTGDPVFMSSFEQWWSYAQTNTACDAEREGLQHHGQPYVLFDHMSGRWIVADVAYDEENVDIGPYYICIAVSNGAPYPTEPLEGAPPDNSFFTNTYWYYYAFNTNEGVNLFYPDMPKLGLWPEGIYMSADLYDVYNNGLNRTPKGVKVWAIDRGDLVAGYTPPPYFPPDYVDFYLPEHMGYEHLVPTTLLGNPPPTGTPNYFASIQPNRFHIWEFHVDWTDPGRSTFGTLSLDPNYTIDTNTQETWAFGYIIKQRTPCEVLPGDCDGDPPADYHEEQLNAHGDRLMSPLHYRIVDDVPSLWTTHAVLDGNVVGMRWYEIRHDNQGEPYFYQQGTYNPDDFYYRWMGSVAVDKAGNMALGYSASSGDKDCSSCTKPGPIYPSVMYTGRLKTDPLGTLYPQEALMHEGTAIQYDDDLLLDGPWGRQSQMTVDPLDECVFWYTNMYYDLEETLEQSAYPIITNWKTRIGWFAFPECYSGGIERVSLHTNNTQGNDSSGMNFEMYSTATSGTGRYVVFSSDASTLVDGDTNNRRDIFLRDRDTDGDNIFDEPGDVLTVRISKGYNGTQSNGDSWEVSISENGNLIAFSSDANNLIEPGKDTNGARDVFVYDRTSGYTELVSRATGLSGVIGNSSSDNPFISPDGKYVAYRSFANNLIGVGNDTNTYADIFLRDLGPDTTTLISVTGAGVQANDESFTPVVANGGRVAFASYATNLVAPAPPPPTWSTQTPSHVYVKHPAGSIGMCDIDNQGGNAPNDIAYHPYISKTGHWCAFASRAQNLDVVPVDQPNDWDADIFLHEIGTTNVYRVSTNFFGGQAANGDSYSPSVSESGRYVTFASDASNMDHIRKDINGYRDIFLADMDLVLRGITQYGLIQRISLDYMGGEPNSWSFAPSIATYKLQVAFVSEATDLVTDDTNNFWDVFAYDSGKELPTFLSIPSNISGSPGPTKVEVPINFEDNGREIDTTTFSIDFDEACLGFDPLDVTNHLPTDFIVAYSYDPADTNGEIDFSIYDQVAPRMALPDGTMVTLEFTVKSTCQAPLGATKLARVGFSADPKASFATYGKSVLGTTEDGSINVGPVALGDCNGDGYVDAGDIPALVLEIFDGDDTNPANAPYGTFPGNAVGCNPNQDYLIDAGDLSCTISIIQGDSSCTGVGTALVTDVFVSTDPVMLTIPADVAAIAGNTITIPIRLQTNGNEVNSMVFSLDLDQTWLTIDGDNLEDVITFQLPNGFIKSPAFDASDADGELDFVIYHPTDPKAKLSDGDIILITIQTGSPVNPTLASILGSQDPRASFGTTDGQSTGGILVDGAVYISGSGLQQVYLPMTMFK